MNRNHAHAELSITFSAMKGLRDTIDGGKARLQSDLVRTRKLMGKRIPNREQDFSDFMAFFETILGTRFLAPLVHFSSGRRA